MWKLAWRNLWRNRTRSLITGTAISVTFALMLITFSVSDDSYDSMLKAAAKTAGGDVLVHAEGYWADPVAERFLTDPAPLLDKVATVPGVRAVIPRVLIEGLVSSPRGSAGVRLEGIDPPREAALKNMGKWVEQGTFLTEQPNGKQQPLVLGKGIVKDLKLELGDRVVLTATDPEGEMVRALFKLTGVLDTGSKQLDDIAAYTTIDAARSATGIGAGLTQIAALLDDPDGQIGPVREAIRRALAPPPGVAVSQALEVLTWDEAIPEMLAFVEVDRKMGTLFTYLIFVVVAFGIMNTFMMAVIERIRELGLLAALGLTPARTAGLVLRETILLALVTTAVGLGLAFGMHAWLVVEGIDYAALTGGADIEVSGVILEDMIIRSLIIPERWISAWATIFLLVIAAGLYPAWRAARLQPTEAMRTYE